MESGRFLIAVILMIAVVVITNVIFPPARPEPGQPVPGDSIRAAADTVVPRALADTLTRPSPAPSSPRPVAPSVQETPDAPATQIPADTITIASPLYRFGVSTRGGALVSVLLEEYASMSRPGQRVQLAPEESDGLVTYGLKLGTEVVDLGGLAFTPERAGDLTLSAGGEPQTLRLVHRDSAGAPAIELAYTFDPDTYLVQVRARVDGATEAPQLLLHLGPTLPFNEAKPDNDQHALAYVVNGPTDGIQSQTLSKLDEQRVENGPLTWVAIKNMYFVAALLAADSMPQPFGGVIAAPTAAPYSADLTATLLPDQAGDFRFRIYAGPQEQDRLTAIGQGFQDVNPFGYRVLRPILRPLGHAITWALVGMHSVLGIGYGWVLILFGVIIRVVLWPLNAKAMRSQMKNMEIQPRLKEIQARYKSEPEKLQKEMLRLYKEEGFNPMGGCLPMLIPFPILIALFFVFQSTIVFRGVSFLWLPDLSQADPFYVLPIVLGVSMFVLQWLSMRSTKDANPQMKMMMWIMPIFMTVIFLNLASGLNLYYAAQNLASVPQQIQIIKERQRVQLARAT